MSAIDPAIADAVRRQINVGLDRFRQGERSNDGLSRDMLDAISPHLAAVEAERDAALAEVARLRAGGEWQYGVAHITHAPLGWRLGARRPDRRRHPGRRLSGSSKLGDPEDERRHDAHVRNLWSP